MRKIILISLVLCMILGVFAACDFGGTETEGTTSETLESSESQSSEKESSDATSSEQESAGSSDTESSAGSESSSESESGDGDELWPDIEAGIPSYVEDYGYTSPDGYEFKQYDVMAIEDYYAAYKYYLEEGFSLYSENQVGDAVSATFVNGDEYAVIMFNTNEEQLYLGYSESGAEAFPEVVSSYGEGGIMPTITQHYSEDSNGMCYFIKLSDGSFLIIDGGYDFDMEDAYQTLVKLNGSADGILIRAWLITHAHGDHYEMFSTFANTYADKVTLERVMYSPVNRGVEGHDAYFTRGLPGDIALFDGAVLCPVHTGMSFTFGNVEFEILASPEHIYKDDNDPEDFNESSVVVRAVHAEGSMIFLADCGINVCEWMIDAYGDGLKSDMVQVAHHGGETANAEVYDAIQAHTLFWPCNEPLLNTERGGTVKQHILEAEYSKEHLLHSYGNITRPINYKAEEPEYIDLFPTTLDSYFYKSPNVDNVRFEDGVLKYEVVAGSGSGLDPNFCYGFRVSTSKCNAIRIVIDSDDLGGEMYYSTGTGNTQFSFNESKMQRLGVTGESEDGKTTLIIFLGDAEGYSDAKNLTALRLDFGTEIGQTVEIYSIEGFYVNVDAK